MEAETGDNFFEKFYCKEEQRNGAIAGRGDKIKREFVFTGRG